MRRSAALALAVVALATAVPSAASAPPLVLDAAATSSAPAVALAPLPIDLVSVYQTGEMTTSVREAALAAARAAGAAASIGRGFTIGLTAVRRGATVVQVSTGPGWAFPMSVTALPIDVIGATMGRAVSGPIGAGGIVMGETSASIRGAQAGDTVDLVAANGTIRTFTIGRVAPDAEVGGTELVMSLPQADLLGAVHTTRVLVYGLPSRSALDGALAAYKLTTNSSVRIRRSWDAFDPDGTLGMAQTKSLLGEFDYYYAGISTNGWTAMNAAWVAAHLPPEAETFPTGIRARCHDMIRADLTAALQEIVDTLPGLVNNPSIQSDIDVANTNSYGGCGIGLARFARITQNLGSISRHSWAQPIDISTAANGQGTTPKMDCRIVRIFRAHNFAWGGNFLTPDGMHFEWVGTQRDGYLYPSKYCPNLPGGQTQAVRPPPGGNRATFFADDGWALDTDTH
jgi:hypothetical protein